MTPTKERRVSEVKRVKVSEPLLAELARKWSRPVEVMIARVDEDGDLELTFRTVPDRDELEAGLKRERQLREEREKRLDEIAVLLAPIPISLKHSAALERAHRLARTRPGIPTDEDVEAAQKMMEELRD